ncbi:MAG: DUF4956 domain-containing protein [Bacteroidales bacterium]
MTDSFYDLTNPNFVGIMWRFALNLVVLFILIRLIYFKYSKKERYLFYFSIMGIMAFFITAMLKSVFIEMGMAVGLVAIFAIIRLRSSNFTAKDIAYTYTIFGISVINSLKLLKFPLLGLLIINAIIVLAAYLLEEYTAKYHFERLSIIYDKLDLLKPEKKEKFLKDVSARTGREVLRVKIRRINYKRKRAFLDVYFKDKTHLI